MATDEGSNYTLLMNSDLASEEWELYEACGLSETTELPIESRAVIEDPLDCIPSITNPNSETQVVDAIGLDHVYQRNSSDAAPTVTECQPGLESPTCISLPELPKLSNPKPALDDPINRPVGSMSSTKSLSFLLDHTYSAQPSKKPPSKQQPSKKLPMCELCRPRTFFSNRLVLTEHYKWHLFEDANVGVQKPSIQCLLEQTTGGIKQTSEVDSQLHIMANAPKETSISPQVRPSTLCLQKVRKAAQDTNGILQSSKKNVFDQLQQTQSTENIKQISEKTDSQLHTTANVFDETTCLLKQPTESIGKTTEGTSQSLLLCDLLGADKQHPVTRVYHTSINKTALRDDHKTNILGNIFRCIWCKKFFSQFESFKQHKCKKKSGKANPCALINTYLCEYCGVSFARHGNFMKHIVLHKQTQSIVNIKQTSKNTDSRPHAIESVLQEPDVSPPVKPSILCLQKVRRAAQKQSALSLLKRSKEIIKWTSKNTNSRPHAIESVLQEPNVSPPVKPSILCLQKVRRAAQDTDGILQSSQKNFFDQLQQSQSIVNIKQTIQNTNSRSPAIEGVLQEPDVSPQKQSVLSLLKQSKEIVKQTGVKGDSQGHQQQRLFTLSGPDYVPEDKMALKNNNTSCTIGKHPQCSWCKKYFARQVWFEQHMCKMNSFWGNSNSRTHIKHLCENCGYFVKLPDNYTKHSALHRCKELDGCSPVLDSAATSDANPKTSNSSNRITPFRCLTCSKAFAFESQLLQHEKLHRRRRYLCEYCGLFIKLSNNYTKQLALHRCMKLGRCSPVLDSAATSDAIPETSNSYNRTTPFQCSTCSKAFAFGSQLLRHQNLHRLESRRPVPKRERSDSESGDESFGNTVKKVQSGKEGSRGEERFGWKFRIKEPDVETGSGTRKRGAGGKGNLQEGPKSAPRWGGKARTKGKVKHFFCRACDKGFYHPWQLRKHKALHTELSCNKCNGLVFSSSSELNNHLFIGLHNEQVQSARHEKRGSEASAPQGDTEPSTPKELESVQSGHPKGRMISSVATGLKSVQSGKSRTSSMSKKVDLASSGQSKGRTKTLPDKKLKSVQSRHRNGSNKSSKDKKIKSVQHGHSTTTKEFSSRTKYSECSQSGQPVVSAAEPLVSAVGTKPIHCDQCGKEFLQLCKLNFHKLKCREFNCDKCEGLTFSSNAELKSHMLGHTNKFKCPKCGAQFASQKLLTNHTARHSDLVPNICDVCELAFNSLKALKMHKIMYHF
ncbi:zinc finger protein 62 homolog [Strongylocentrotus purpuratus]|uniref:C2H2-type domain-containing protein n=1 Tax=Strongylocentrotus purpuratus TaxID=7668 RepID=A0A7M7NB63_STRPU|nr:zinc finger protein 62 homolog [Strongylocentrotus purpuratus]